MKQAQSHREVLSVSQLNHAAKQLLEGQFPLIWVEGEMSNLSIPSSGHWYFTLKDNGAQIRCAMFRGRNSRIRFRPESGQQVLVRAKLSLFEARGDYQLIAEHMELAGDGALARAFEQLKQRLQAEGLFDPQYKQALPTLPRHIAVITSSTGAAIRDILTVLARRFPAIQVSILPVAVQGSGAATEIARAIASANQQVEAGLYNFDLIITGRGGGSMEDLWAFNEEIVARAIFASQLPIISAIGHETDFTIADFVADARAPTPSAAAEMISPDSRELLQNFLGYEQLLTRRLTDLLAHLKQQLDWSRTRLRHPGSRLQEHSQRLDELEMRIINAWHNQRQHRNSAARLISVRLQQQNPLQHIERLQLVTSTLYRQLEQALLHRLQQWRQQLRSSSQLLETVSPLATLSRGYSITSDARGQLLRRVEDTRPGDSLVTQVGNGKVISTVDEIVPGDN